MSATAALPRAFPSRQTVEDGILRQVRTALRESGYTALKRVGCRLIEGEVVLSGQLSSYYLKQVAQQSALRTVQFAKVRNLIRVD